MAARVLFPWLTSWWKTVPPPPTGDHKGPPNPTSTTLAPTDGPASCLTSRLRLMRMRADKSAVCAINRPLRLVGVICLSASSAPPVHPSIHPSIHGRTPLKKDTYRLGKNDVLLRTVPPHKSGYTSSEATHETSSEPCSQDTSSTGPLRRTPCMERSPISKSPPGTRRREKVERILIC